MIANSVASRHPVEFIDLMWEKSPEKKTLEVVRSFQPQVIGISIRNLDSQDSRKSTGFVEEMKPFVACIREVTDAVIVLGGTAFTTFPIELLNYLGADYGIAGQGEKVFPRLIEGIESERVDLNLPGLVYRKDGHTLANQPLLEGYADAYTPKKIFYDPRRYARSFWPSIVVSKTGCHFNCIYCDVRLTLGGKFKLRSPDTIVTDLEYQVEKLKTRTIFLVDTCFNHPLDHAKSILEAIIKNNRKLFLGTILRPDNLDEELISMMKKAGIRFIGLGADTLSDTMLDNYQKGFSIADVEKSCRLIEKHNISYMLELVVGGPGETTQTVDSSLKFLAKVRPTLAIINAGFRILPDTHLYDLALREGIVKNRQDILFPKYYFSKNTPPEWLYRRIQGYYKRYGYRQIRTPWLFYVKKPMHLWLSRGR